MTKRRKTRRRGLPLRFWIISTLILISIVFGVVKLIDLVKPILGFQDVKLKRINEIKINNDLENVKVKAKSINKYLVLSQGNNVLLFDEDGKALWEKDISISEPCFGGGLERLVISDLEKGHIFYLDEKGNSIKDIIIGEPLYDLKVDNKGNSLAILESSSMVYIYDNNGEEIGNFQVPKGEIIEASMDVDNNILALSILTIEENKFYSNIILYNIEGKVLAGKKHDNKIIYELEFINGDEIMAVGDSSVLVFNKSNGIVWEKTLDDTINTIDFNNEGIAAINLIKKKSILLDTKNRTTITTINPKGKIMSQTPLPEDIKGIDIYRNNILAFSNRTLFILDSKREINIEKKLSKDIKEAWWISKTSIGVVYRDEIHILKMTP